MIKNLTIINHQLKAFCIDIYKMELALMDHST